MVLMEKDTQALAWLLTQTRAFEYSEYAIQPYFLMTYPDASSLSKGSPA